MFLVLAQYFSGENLKQELSDVDNLTVERLDEMSELFLKDYKNGQLKSNGWPDDSEYLAYKVSKALINGYTRIMSKKYPELRIIACTLATARLTSTLTLANTPQRMVPVALFRWPYCRREAQQVCSSSAQKKHHLCST